jgi:hypothetical protein
MLKHRAPLARGHLPAKIFFTMSDLIKRNILTIPNFPEPLTWALKEVDPVDLHRQSGIHAPEN